MSKKQLKSRYPLRRRLPSTKVTGKTILIVTEGGKTEPIYLIELRNRLRLSSVQIEVVPATQTDPLSVVNHGIKLRDCRKREARRGCVVEYNEVWVVFDTECTITNPKLNDAIQKAEAKSIKVALSNPCFEFWLLLHHEYTTSPFQCCDRVIRFIKQTHFPNYNKGSIPMDCYFQKIPIAVLNAEKCRRYHSNAQTDGNPSSQVDLLVREMNAATRPHYQLSL